jgi:hypothetical protein
MLTRTRAEIKRIGTPSCGLRRRGHNIEVRVPYIELAFYAAAAYIAAHMPADTATPEETLRARLVELIDTALAHMLESTAAEPAFMRLIADASVTLAVLDARTQSKD